ncbi:MAG: DNA polymerase III subunit beta [Deltaproteobacteria bacterium]|nr:DNA polymerase III subunit beta [Deltaproteobacteria bacterium]
MEVTITKSCLAAALARTAGIADRKSSMQILSNVLIETSGVDNVRIATTDLNLSAAGVFPAQVTEGGAFTVPARTLNGVVKSIPDGQISLRTEGEQVHVLSGRTQFKLLSLPAEDFPILPTVEGVEFFEMDAALLMRMIEQTSFSISSDETRPHINGALFQGDGKNLRMVTTDGHRLSKVEVQTEESGFYNFSMVVPNKGIAEIRRLVEDSEGNVSIAVQGGSVFLRKEIEVEKEQEDTKPVTAEFVLVSKLIESEFPPYDQVIPEKSDRKVIISRAMLSDALRRMSVVSSERTLGVKFQFSEGCLEIATNNPSVGEGSEQLDVDYDGNDMEIGFNARYFIDILNVLGDEEVKVGLSGPLDPVVVTDMEDTFIGVVMPMRI